VTRVRRRKGEWSKKEIREQLRKLRKFRDLMYEEIKDTTSESYKLATMDLLTAVGNRISTLEWLLDD